MGTWTAISFSQEQQDQFGVNEDGEALDQAKFDLAIQQHRDAPVAVEAELELELEEAIEEAELEEPEDLPRRAMVCKMLGMCNGRHTFDKMATLSWDEKGELCM